MWFESVHDEKLADFEARIAAAAFLSGLTDLPVSIPEDARARIVRLLEKLRELPGTWARDLCFDALSEDELCSK